jgi:hypothetical protein
MVLEYTCNLRIIRGKYDSTRRNFRPSISIIPRRPLGDALSICLTQRGHLLTEDTRLQRDHPLTGPYSLFEHRSPPNATANTLSGGSGGDEDHTPSHANFDAVDSRAGQWQRDGNS